VIDGSLNWRLSMNHGSAFGLFANSPGLARVFLSLVDIGAVIAMLFMLKKSRDDQAILHYALALVVGGAVGNLIDRMYFGVVTDFVLWHYHTKEWPVFNVADVVLVVGVGLMFIDIQKEKNRDKRSKKEKSLARDEAARKAGLIKDHRE
jgi:signal peptidase II